MYKNSIKAFRANATNKLKIHLLSLLRVWILCGETDSRLVLRSGDVNYERACIRFILK
jgi:hypothetical protein